MIEHPVSAIHWGSHRSLSAQALNRFLETQVGNIGAFHRDIDRQFREEYLKPSYQSLRY